MDSCSVIAFQISLRSKLGLQIFHTTIALHAVAVPTQQLQIANVICAAFGAWDDMVNGEIQKRKQGETARANALLPPKQRVLVRPVIG